MERGIRELKEDEAESTDAWEKLVSIVFLRTYPRCGSGAWD